MNPRGPKIEDQGPWILYFSLTYKHAFETLIIKIGPQFLLTDPKNPPKNPKGAWEISG